MLLHRIDPRDDPEADTLPIGHPESDDGNFQGLLCKESTLALLRDWVGDNCTRHMCEKVDKLIKEYWAHGDLSPHVHYSTKELQACLDMLPEEVIHNFIEDEYYGGHITHDELYCQYGMTEAYLERATRL